MTGKYPTEHAEQCAVATWLRMRGVWFFAVPNGAKMGPAEAAKMKREGLEPGVPDLLIVDNGKMLALELKSRDPKARASKEQKAWLLHLDGEGWDCKVAHGAEEAISWLQQHLG
jgi:hypothetical protein